MSAPVRTGAGMTAAELPAWAESRMEGRYRLVDRRDAGGIRSAVLTGGDIVPDPGFRRPLESLFEPAA